MRVRITQANGTTFTGYVQGNGGLMLGQDTLRRLRLAKTMAEAGRDTFIFEPRPGHVQVYANRDSACASHVIDLREARIESAEVGPAMGPSEDPFSEAYARLLDETANPYRPVEYLLRRPQNQLTSADIAEAFALADSDRVLSFNTPPEGPGPVEVKMRESEMADWAELQKDQIRYERAFLLSLQLRPEEMAPAGNASTPIDKKK